ncbi:unnamed protein product [Closterium sp. NIES-54]
MLGSSCEAEIYAGAMAAHGLRWLTYLLTDLGERPRSPLVLYVDNKATLALCHRHRLEHRTKHIALRYFLARELQQHGSLLTPRFRRPLLLCRFSTWTCWAQPASVDRTRSATFCWLLTTTRAIPWSSHAEQGRCPWCSDRLDHCCSSPAERTVLAGPLGPATAL